MQVGFVVEASAAADLEAEHSALVNHAATAVVGAG